MGNIKESLSNIKKHLDRLKSNQETDNPVMYIKEVEHIINVLNICVDENKTMLGLGFRNYSSNKEYKDFSVSEMLDKGFIVSGNETEFKPKKAYVVFVGSHKPFFIKNGELVDVCVVIEKESVSETKKYISNALEQYLQLPLDFYLPDINECHFLGSVKSEIVNSNYYIKCLELK